MKQIQKFYLAGLMLAILGIYSNLNAQEKKANWQQLLNEQIQLLGHRNWILVVDAAYPLQSNQGIKTIVSGEEQLDVVKTVLQVIGSEKHVNPEVFLDMEIDFVPEKAAKGIGQYRTDLHQLLKGSTVSKVLHEDLISMVDQSAETFNILVIKSNSTIPYTSVFFRLNCGYWDADAEQQMRVKMEKNK
ncbi:MAG: hypothetical protein N4A71_16890 [Carboxylicivirga sp.]|jgi:D-ribose pyranose/furanose isomerase RbsD|nr:hypothetical protein [Carboxylicivirga sp.]